MAVAVRAIYFATRAHTDAFQLPIVDAELFDKAARAFADGRPTSPEDWFFHGPGYPTILGLLYAAFGSSILVAKAVQLGFGVLTSTLTYLVARDIFDRRTALLGGFIVAAYAPLIFLEGELLDAGWTALLAIALLFLTLRAIRSERWPWGLAWGAVAAAAILVRATFIPYCLLALGLMAAQVVRRNEPHRWRTVGAATAMMAAALSGAAYGTLEKSGRFTVLPSSAGLNLYIGNNAERCRTLALRPGLDWDLLEKLPREAGVVGVWNESDWFRRRAVDYAVHSPASYLAGLARKAGAARLAGDPAEPRRLPISRRIDRVEGGALEAGLIRLSVWAARAARDVGRHSAASTDSLAALAIARQLRGGPGRRVRGRPLSDHARPTPRHSRGRRQSVARGGSCGA